jgi:diguanylate cyclase (GGDEF)-like protein
MMERNLEHISYHDALTGIYNRTYFYNRMKALSAVELRQAGLIVLDVDGLKLVNDTFGHEEGDRIICTAAQTITSCIPDQATAARIGGDEFVVLLPQADRELVEKIVACIHDRIANCNHDARVKNMPVRLSMGFALATDGKYTAPEEMLAVADKRMYREKLMQASSRHSQIITALTEMLAARDYIADGHASRVQELVMSLAHEEGVESFKLPDMELFAHFHDIGKVGIADNILNKPGPLTDSERKEMQAHSEIGHRIARATEDLAPISDWILKHHERWDGKGYPLGLTGTNIPIECRILAIADSYDAMTSDRPYHKAISKEAAVAEIRRNAGYQFDPDLTVKFEKIVWDNAWLRAAAPPSNLH